jgi:hypothetical protein
VNTQPSITAQDQALLAHTIQTTKILTDVESYKKYISLLSREAVDNFKVAMHPLHPQTQQKNVPLQMSGLMMKKNKSKIH